MGVIHQYKTRIMLRTNNIWDTESRVEEVRSIREWICEQCEWDPDKFEIRIHSSGCIMDVWFEDEQSALMCKLRWA